MRAIIGTSGIPMTSRVLRKLARQIDKEYDRLGHTLGWRFLTCPGAVLSAKTEVVFVTLNPGGNVDRPEHPRLSCEDGSPYLTESWSGQRPGRSNLQVQVQALYKRFGISFDETLSGQLVPFRSPSWEELPRREESLAFGQRLWAQVIKIVKPSLVIGMGKKKLRQPLRQILGTPIESIDVPVNWGPVSAGLDWFPGCALITLPHLSRFGIMTRPQSESAISELIARSGWAP
jgi:hypothetical protein